LAPQEDRREAQDQSGRHDEPDQQTDLRVIQPASHNQLVACGRQNLKLHPNPIQANSKARARQRITENRIESK
jgi:hypothetical protein